jgi:hypothetical protein
VRSNRHISWEATPPGAPGFSNILRKNKIIIIKTISETWKRAPGFREVVLVQKLLLGKTGDRFPVFLRDCGRTTRPK